MALDVMEEAIVNLQIIIDTKLDFQDVQGFSHFSRFGAI
jgi:hypothetical protein